MKRDLVLILLNILIGRGEKRYKCKVVGENILPSVVRSWHPLSENLDVP
jgi:hypothetical protein